MNRFKAVFIRLIALWMLMITSIGAAEERGSGRACPWGSANCNACVADVRESVNELRTRGDILGFYLGPAPEPSQTKHWQGIQRLMVGPVATLLVSSSNKDQAGLSLVRMGSRVQDGLRLRSNRLARADVQHTSPPDVDRIERYLGSPFSDYKHASGFQSVGHFVAVGLEISHSGQNAMVKFFDYSNPSFPLELTQSALSPSQYGRKDAGTTSLAQLNDQRYLLIVGGSDAKKLAFYKSTTTDLRNTAWTRVARWDQSVHDLLPGSIDTGWGAYQNINIVSQCDGQLFLVATHNSGAFGQGDDWIDAYRLHLESRIGTVGLLKVAKRHVFCSWGRLADQCNLDAAGGLYVDPVGRLLVYATENSNNGPEDSIKMEEFRSQSAPADCSRIDRGWIELYDDKQFKDRGLMIDFRDREKEHYRNFHQVEGFGNMTSSVRWCLPNKWRFVLFEHSGFRGNTQTFAGTRSLSERGELPGFNDDASSGRFECLHKGAWTNNASLCNQEQQVALDAAIRLSNF